MTHNTMNSSTFGRLAVALLLASAATACSPVDAPTAPAATAVVTKAAAQAPTAATYTLAAAPGAASAISSDGVSVAYRDAVCGVTARVFFSSPDYRDGNLQLDNPRATDRKCVAFGAAAYPRKFTITYPDNGLTQTNTGGLNVFDMGTVVLGTPGLRSMNVRIEGAGARCASLRFGSVAGSSPVLVTRLSSTSWSVASQAGDTAACISPSGTTSFITNFAVAFTVTLN